MRTGKAAALGSTLLLLTSCVFVDPESVRRMPVSGSPLQAALHQSYVEAALDVEARGRTVGASLLAWKARASGRGDSVGPESLDDWQLPAAMHARLDAARGRLLVKLARASRDSDAAAAARAQVAFDCWVEAADAKDTVQARTCADSFEAALDVGRE